MGLFGGSSDSETNQTNTQKDNSALLEGSGLNVTDGASGARGEAISILGNKNRTSMLRQEGFNFGGARKTLIEPGTALMMVGGVVLSVYLYSKK
ncbi:hypothetical protein DDZ13_06585 [Coraliomargarita sinensis]|uniref:Uncharacterized protein n=1 Tax=Coraliomargarita sinensis TaxID=2174842 RepID=A0A317ZGW5_9BACT|nr:hypothetical protein [Coraliomargarita sinensis]PXA04826.1 hypothetical protein DDZ13_06585 [Coraliomargarita sinensis]